MPNRVIISPDVDTWTDDLPTCSLAGIGSSPNCSYKASGHRTDQHACEDAYFHLRPASGDQTLAVYGVFDGHDGDGIAKYSSARMPAELLMGQLDKDARPDEVKDAIAQAFSTVESGYFHCIDDVLAKRSHILTQMEFQNLTPHEMQVQYPQVAEQLQELNYQVACGSSAAVCLILNHKLYFANVGDARILLCKQATDGGLRVLQVTVDHTVNNADERLRLAQLGLSDSTLGHFAHPTRCLGCYPMKGGYKDYELISSAMAEPVIPDPEISGGYEIDSSMMFLILMTAGVYQALEDATGCADANVQIASLVGTAFHQQETLDAVAQSVVDDIARIHKDAYLRSTGSGSSLTSLPPVDPGGESRTGSSLCRRREDMTLMVRNLNYYPQVIAPVDTHASTQSLTTLPPVIPTNTTVTVDEGPSPEPSPPAADGTQRRIEAYVDFGEYYEFMESYSQRLMGQKEARSRSSSASARGSADADRSSKD